jgi:hypothetical protein
MPSAIDISSNALLLIGDEGINSFDEPGAGARAAKAFYAQTKQAVLAWHPWSFALKDQELSQLSQTPDTRTNLKYAYQLPTDMIRIWELMPFGYYELVNGLLLTNEPTLLMRYIYDVDDTAMPPHVVKALEYKLAAEFAMSVTEDENRAQLYERKHINQLATAAGIDSQGRPQEAIKRSPFTEARFTGTLPTDGFGGF